MSEISKIKSIALSIITVEISLSRGSFSFKLTEVHLATSPPLGIIILTKYPKNVPNINDLKGASKFCARNNIFQRILLEICDKKPKKMDKKK